MERKGLKTYEAEAKGTVINKAKNQTIITSSNKMNEVFGTQPLKEVVWRERSRIANELRRQNTGEKKLFDDVQIEVEILSVTVIFSLGRPLNSGELHLRPPWST